MAESESGADKSEEPTSKRLEEARQKGQIARSKELGTLAVTFGGAAALLIFGAEMGRAMLDLMQGNFALSREVLLDEGSMARYLLRTGMEALLALQPFFIVMLIASIIGPVAVGGWLFSGEALQPKFSRMNPLQGIKRMFSAHALVELLKALAKFIIILLVALAVLKADQDDLLAIANEKNERYRQLQRLTDERSRLLGRAALTSADAAMRTLFGNLPRVLVRWDELVSAARQARDRNALNGKLILERMAGNQAALSILLSAANHPQLYDADGLSKPTGGGRMLGSA